MEAVEPVLARNALIEPGTDLLRESNSMNRMQRRARRRAVFSGLLSFSTGTHGAHYAIALPEPAGTSGSPQGVLWMQEETAESAAVEITAIDDNGCRSSSETFPPNACAVVEFRPSDLSDGNPAKGVSNDLGIGDGHFRIVLDTDICRSNLRPMSLRPTAR